MYKKKKVPPLTICHYSSYCFTHYLGKPSLKKKIMENSITSLTPYFGQNYGKFCPQNVVQY